MPSKICAAASRSWPVARISMSSWKAVEVGPGCSVLTRMRRPRPATLGVRQRGLVDTHELELRPLGGEPAGGGETDAGLATRDQGDLARQAHYGVVVDSV